MAARRTIAAGRVGCSGDRVEQHAAERAGAQLAEHRTGEEVPLRGGGAGGEAREQFCADRRRAGPGGADEFVEGVVDVGDGEGRFGGMLDYEGSEAAPSDAQPSLMRSGE